MARFSKTDKILVGVMLPFFAVVFSLHVREVMRTGIAQAPFFAAPPSEPAGYPSVGGPRLEHGVDRSGLRVGDWLIRVGDTDLAGAGYLGFDALAVEAAGDDASAPLVYERDGVRHTVALELIPYPQPWMRIPFLLSTAVVGTVVLIRVPRRRDTQRFFFACMCLAIFELHFFGGSRWQSYASLVIFNFGGGVALWALLRWVISFPAEVPDSARLSPRWAWLGALFVVLRLNYMLGGPIPSERVPFAVLASDAFFLVLITSILTWNTRYASAVGRRRTKWVLFGAYLATVPMLLSLLPSFVHIPGVDYFETLPFGMIFGAAFPITMWIAIVRYDLFDIDRILSSTASYSLAAGIVLAGVIVLTPSLAAVLGEQAGLDEELALVVLAAALVFVAPALTVLVRSRFERLVFPDRQRREAGFRKLILDFAECRTTSETLRLFADRVSGILEPGSVWVLVRVGDELVPLEASGPTSLASLSARSQLALGLEAHPEPLAVDDGTLSPRLARLPQEEREALAGKGVRVLVPVRDGKDLFGLLCVGEARSGDIYTSTVLTLLGAAAERASVQLGRLSDAASLELERERSRRLRSLKEGAEAASLAKSRLLAAASHDLRQPLHALGLFVGQLDTHLDAKRKGDDGSGTAARPDEDLSRLVQRIQSSTDSLNGMLTALLDLSRIDAGGVVPDLEDVDVDRLFARLEVELAPEAEAKGLRLEVRSGGEFVNTDPQLLMLILRNLAINAIRYTEAGSVTLRARPHGRRVAIVVEDTGVGIPEERHQDVFKEFVQLDGAGAGSGGMGLGLSIVDRLARILGHDLELDSSPGRGTRVRLELPARDAVVKPAPRAGTAGDLAGTRVVVVDDDLTNLEAMRTTLQGWGCSVLVAATAEDAVSGIENRGGIPQVILADYSLADGKTGIDAVARIREQVGEPVPATILTGETGKDVLATIERSTLNHLSKPVSPLALRALITEMLRPEWRRVRVSKPHHEASDL